VPRHSRSCWSATCALAFLFFGGACGGDRVGPSAELPTPSFPPLTGSLDVVVNGLSVDGAIRVSGPGGFVRTITASTLLTGLPATTYSVVATAVQSALYDFVPTTAEFLVTIGAGFTSTATVTYVATSGALTITTSGLPPEKIANITVTGAGTTTTVATNETIGRLKPGVYSVTAQSVPDVSLRYTAPNAVVTIVAGATRSVFTDYRMTAAARTTSDRPDDANGAQLKVLYAVPSDGTDRGLDTAGVLQRSISSWQRWLATQTGGRYLRLETVGGSLDVLFVRLSRPDLVYRNYGAAIRDSLEKDLTELGVIAESLQKIYLVYYEGGHKDRCGSAAWPPLLPGRVAAVYLHGSIIGGPNCNTNLFASTGTSSPGYLEFVAMHEVLHLLGLVSVNAPDHGLSGHLTTDPSDVMYAGTAPWTPSRLDPSRRNYFNPAGLPIGVANFATSPFVVTP